MTPDKTGIIRLHRTSTARPRRRWLQVQAARLSRLLDRGVAVQEFGIEELKL
jgi:hypothetical protein